MTLFDAINVRKSVRNYSSAALTPEEIAKITEYAENAPQLPALNGDSEVKIISLDGSLRAPGTYGVINGASTYLVLLHQSSQMSALNAGYFFEHIVLYCTSLGLGTCWIGGTFKRSDFTAHISVPADKIIDIVSPVGVAADKLRFRDKLMKKIANSNSRKPFDSLFFSNEFSEPIKPDTDLVKALDAVRVAPSAKNEQQWRVSVDGDKVRFYCTNINSHFGAINMGIAICHFEVACKHYGINGEWQVENAAPKANNLDYTITFLLK